MYCFPHNKSKKKLIAFSGMLIKIECKKKFSKTIAEKTYKEQKGKTSEGEVNK